MAGSNATPRGVPRRILQGEGPRVPSMPAGSIPTIQYSSGSAKALADFSRSMFAISDEFEDQLDAQAEAEATTAGAIDGASGNFTLQTYGTIRGRAYNKAAVETFAATVDTNAIMQLASIQQQYWNDPEGMQRAWDDYTTATAEELAKTSPEQAVIYRNRQAVRGLPAIEAAKDTAYKLTRSEADAALIAQETAIRQTVKESAADLFSENPERSRAAANAIGMIQRDYMSIYNAVDATTGKPLYTPEEIAKAKNAFRDLTMTQAGLAWFDEQPNKAEAYLKLTSGEFKIKLNSSNDHVPVIMANKGATRNDPIQPGLKSQLQAAAAASGEGLSVVVHSGGQETAVEVAEGKGSRTGSTRHDHGGAGDVRLAMNGKVLPFEENRGLYRKFAQNLAATGVTGIGVDEKAGYIHAGGGSQASWGYKGKANGHEFLPDDFNQAIEAGRAGEKIDPNPTETEVPFSSTLSPEAFNGLDAEMRQRIGFTNSMVDRAREEQAKAVTKLQELNSYDLAAAIYGAGQTDPDTGKPVIPPSIATINELVRDGKVKADDGKALIKALTTEKPDVSDEETVRDLQRRIYAGEDVYQDIIAAGSKISRKDAASLLSTNQSVVRNQLGEFNADQKYYFNTLSDRLGQKNQFMPFDPAREARSAQALDEYRRRVMDPNRTETASQISDDIATRFTTADADLAAGDINALVIPRFAVKIPNERRIDINQSGKALNAARKAKQISDSDYEQQMKLLMTWRDLQDREEKAKDTKKGNK